MRSIVYSVPLREAGMELAVAEAERLVGPLNSIYGRAKRLMGLEAIKVWVQMSPDSPRLNIYLESRTSITDELAAGLESTDPLDLQLKELFEIVTGRTWEDVIGEMVLCLLDWRAGSTATSEERESS
jgi:hypothetical protein